MGVKATGNRKPQPTLPLHYSVRVVIIVSPSSHAKSQNLRLKFDMRLGGSNFDFEEAKSQYLRLKFDMRSTPIFNMDLKKFWVRVVTGFVKAMRHY